MITNLDIRRRLGRMEQSYSLADPYGCLKIRPVVSSGSVSGFNPTSAVYCPTTEKVYFGNMDRFIHVLNPKKTGPFENSTRSILHEDEDTSEYSVSAEYDSEYIPEAESENGSMHKATSFTNSNVDGDIEIKFSILISSGASYYYGYKISKNNSSSTLSLSNVIAEGCYNKNIDKSVQRNTPKTIDDLSSYTSYAITATVAAGDTVEIWVGGAMASCAASGGSSATSSATISVRSVSARIFYKDALEESIQWRGTGNFTRKDYIGNFTTYENKYYTDGTYSPVNDKIYYAYTSKELYQSKNGGFGIAKLNPHTNTIEKEISLYNIDPVTSLHFEDANLSEMENTLPLPKKVIYCPSNNKIYILHSNSVKSWITVVNPESDKVDAIFSDASFVGSSDIEYSYANQRIYVTNEAGIAISVIDPWGVSSSYEPPEFRVDQSTYLLLHLNNDFSDARTTLSGTATELISASVIKDHETGKGYTKYADYIQYQTKFSLGSLDPIRPPKGSPVVYGATHGDVINTDDEYAQRWNEKDFNKRQYNYCHTIFDGQSCQKIPYRPEWSDDDELTIEFWINPDGDYFQTKPEYNSSTGKWSYQKYDPVNEPSKVASGDGASMLLFSFGNMHDSVHPTKLGIFGLALAQGTSYSDPNRGKLVFLESYDVEDQVSFGENNLDWGNPHHPWSRGDRYVKSTYISPQLEDLGADYSQYAFNYAEKIKFGKWNHIAVVKEQSIGGTSSAPTRQDVFTFYVNGKKWRVNSYETTHNAGVGFVAKGGHLDILKQNSPFLYIGGTKGGEKLEKVSSINYESEVIKTEIPHGLDTGDSVNFYSKVGAYPAGIDQFTNFYIKKISDNELSVYLNKDDATSAAVIAPINLSSLSEGETGESISDLFLSKDQETNDDHMHYSGLMNGFRISNVARYDRHFRPTRFTDFLTNDRETILLMPGDGTVKTRSNFLEIKSVGVLETTTPNTKTHNIKAWTEDWVENNEVKYPGASYQIPFGHGGDLFKFGDTSGRFDFSDSQKFTISIEANFILPEKIDSSYAGVNQPISLFKYARENWVCEFLVSKIGDANNAPNGSGLYFRLWNLEGDEWGLWNYYLKDPVVDLYGDIYSGVLGNNTWHTFTISCDKSEHAGGKWTMTHNGSSIGDELTFTSNTDIFPPVSNTREYDFCTIGGGYQFSNKGGVFALGKINMSKDGSTVLNLDPNIGYRNNILGSAFNGHRAKQFDSELSGIREMENVEIISLGNTLPDYIGNIAWLNFRDWKPIYDESGAPPLAFRKMGRSYKARYKGGLNRGVAFFKGDHTPSSNEPHDWRLKSDGSYIKHLPMTSRALGSGSVGAGEPIWGYLSGQNEDENSFLGDRNFYIECTVAPIDLSNFSSDASISSEMGLMCFNYDDLDDSSIDWANCPSYAVDGSGAPAETICANSKPRYHAGSNFEPWKSGSSNTGTVGWELKINSSGKVQFNFGSQLRNTPPGDENYYYNGTARSLTGTSTLNYAFKDDEMQWYTIAVSRIGEVISLYVNGVKEATLDIGKESILEHPLVIGLTKYEKMGLLIGKSYNGVTNSSSTPYYFTGLMDEVKVNISNGVSQNVPDAIQSYNNRHKRSVIDSSASYNFMYRQNKHMGYPAYAHNYSGYPTSYLHLNFDNFLSWSTEYDPGYIGGGYSRDLDGQRKFDLDETNFLQEEGIVKIRDNRNEGVLSISKDGKALISGSSRLDLGSNFTIEGWIKGDNNDEVKLINRRNSGGGGWDFDLEATYEMIAYIWGGDPTTPPPPPRIMGYNAVLNIYDADGNISKTLKAPIVHNTASYKVGSTADVEKWVHFAVQIENSTRVSIMIDGTCYLSENISQRDFENTNLSSDQRIEIGGTKLVDNFKITKRPVYINSKKQIESEVDAPLELIKEPDVFHFDDNNLNYGEHSNRDHSLTLKNDYANGDAAYLEVVDSASDFNFGTEDFTVEFFFRCDTLDDLPLGTCVVIGKGTPADHTFYVGLETEAISDGNRRSRLVAEAGGVKLSAWKNDEKHHATESESTKTATKAPLYFYDAEYFWSPPSHIAEARSPGWDHVREDFLIQKYKHVMLCRHTFLGRAYLSLFVDKRLVASSFEVSEYKTEEWSANNPTFPSWSTPQTVNSLTDTSYPLTIGGGLNSNGITNTLFSGNLNLIRVERGNNANLTHSHCGICGGRSASVLPYSLYTGAAGSFEGVSKYWRIDHGKLTEDELNNAHWVPGRYLKQTVANKIPQYGLTDGGYAVGYNETIINMFEVPNHYWSLRVPLPDVDSWYLSTSDILGNSSVSTIDIPGNTELFLNFSDSFKPNWHSFKDISPKNRSVKVRGTKNNKVAPYGVESRYEIAYTPPTVSSAAHFGNFSRTSMQVDYSRLGHEYPADKITARDHRNKWNYFNQEAVIATWVKLDNNGSTRLSGSTQVKTHDSMCIFSKKGMEQIFFHVNDKGTVSLQMKHGGTEISTLELEDSVEVKTKEYAVHSADAWTHIQLVKKNKGSTIDYLTTKNPTEILDGVEYDFHKDLGLTENLSFEASEGQQIRFQIQDHPIKPYSRSVLAYVGSGQEVKLEIELESPSGVLEKINYQKSGSSWATTLWAIQAPDNLNPFLARETGTYKIKKIVLSTTAGWMPNSAHTTSTKLLRVSATVGGSYVKFPTEEYEWNYYIDGKPVTTYVIGNENYLASSLLFSDKNTSSDDASLTIGQVVSGSVWGDSTMQYKGYMAELLISTHVYEDYLATEGFVGLGGQPWQFHESANPIFLEGYSAIPPEKLKFLLTFDDLEDHSMDIDRSLPETENDVVLMLPFDEDKDDKSGHMLSASSRELSHWKYTPVAGGGGSSTAWNINNTSTPNMPPMYEILFGSAEWISGGFGTTYLWQTKAEYGSGWENVWWGIENINIYNNSGVGHYRWTGLWGDLPGNGSAVEFHELGGEGGMSEYPWNRALKLKFSGSRGTTPDSTSYLGSDQWDGSGPYVPYNLVHWSSPKYQHNSEDYSLEFFFKPKDGHYSEYEVGTFVPIMGGTTAELDGNGAVGTRIDAASWMEWPEGQDPMAEGWPEPAPEPSTNIPGEPEPLSPPPPGGMGGSDGKPAGWFWVGMEITQAAGNGLPAKGEIVVSIFDDEDVKHKTAVDPLGMGKNGALRLRQGKHNTMRFTWDGDEAFENSIALDVTGSNLASRTNQADNYLGRKDFVHVYVCRRDGIWFLYVDGKYEDHIGQDERIDATDPHTKAGSINLSNWFIGCWPGTKHESNNWLNAVSHIGGRPIGMFTGYIDGVRELSGIVPYNPISYKWGDNGVFQNVTPVDDITVPIMESDGFDDWALRKETVSIPSLGSMSFWVRELKDLSNLLSTNNEANECVQLFPFEPEYITENTSSWVNEKSIQGNVVQDFKYAPVTGSIGQGHSAKGFWEVGQNVLLNLGVSNNCPAISQTDSILGSGSGRYDGTCYSIFEDSEDWDLQDKEFTIEFWYKKSGSAVSSNEGPFNANGTCVIARQGYGYSRDALGWGVELSYVKEDLGTAFFYWRQRNRLENHVTNLVSNETDPVLWNEDTDVTTKDGWDDLTPLSSPEMRFYFCVDNGIVSPNYNDRKGLHPTDEYNNDQSNTGYANVGPKDSEKSDANNNGTLDSIRKLMATFTLSLGTPTDNTWEHYAVTRKNTYSGSKLTGSIFKTFKNGKIIDTLTFGGASQPTYSHFWGNMGYSQIVRRYNTYVGDYWSGAKIKSPRAAANKGGVVLAIGADTRFLNSGWYLKGNLDEIRISKDIARYTDEFEVGMQAAASGAVESTITIGNKTSSITYCPNNKMLYAFASDIGQAYEIDPITNTIISSPTFSTSTVERVKDSYFCPVNNSILILSYDGIYRVYSFLPNIGSIIKTFSVYEKGEMTYAPGANKVYLAGQNYVYEIGD